MRITPAIIITVCLILGTAMSVRAQEPPVTPTVAAAATPLPEGRIIIELRLDHDEHACVRIEAERRRDGEPVGDFRLCGNDDDRRFRLAAGRYHFEIEDVPTGWELDRTSCHGKDASENTNAGDGEATVVLHDGDEYTCIFRLDKLPEPTPEPTQPALVATQAPGTVFCESLTPVAVQPGQARACQPRVPTSTPVPTATPFSVVGSATVQIVPPSTGDGGLVR